MKMRVQGNNLWNGNFSEDHCGQPSEDALYINCPEDLLSILQDKVTLLFKDSMQMIFCDETVSSIRNVRVRNLQEKGREVATLKKIC